MMIAKPFYDLKETRSPCFRHYAVLTTFPSKITTGISFSRENDTSTRARALSYWKDAGARFSKVPVTSGPGKYIFECFFCTLEQ